MSVSMENKVSTVLVTTRTMNTSLHDSRSGDGEKKFKGIQNVLQRNLEMPSSWRIDNGVNRTRYL